MGKSQTIGFKYYMSLHMGIGRGPCNEIADIWIGGLSIGANMCLVDGSDNFYMINKPDLFGGDEKEGGIQGPMFVYNGARDQELEPARTVPASWGEWGRLTLPSIADSLGGDVPNFRGVMSVWFDGMICALNPYPKEWSFRVRRTTAGWFDDNVWYPAKATINLRSEAGNLIRAMNPAHILYETNTNPEWGRGMPADLIDANSFKRAANQFCDEGMGLCIPWFRQETIKEFIPTIIDHAGAVQFVSRLTGKMTLRLIRNDYVADDLPVFGPDSGLLSVVEDDSSAEESSYNEIIVKGFDPTTKEDIVVPVHNLASIQSQEEMISNTITLKGFPTRELVARAAEREMRVQGARRRLTAVFDRRAWRIEPGMPFKINWPSKNIYNLIVRPGEIKGSGVRSGAIEMKLVQDVFGMPSTSSVQPQPPIWTPPNRVAAPAAAERLFEMNYRDYYRLTTLVGSEIPEGSSVIATVATPDPSVRTDGYDLATHAAGEEYLVRANGRWTPQVKLAGGIQPLDTTITLDLSNSESFLAELELPMVAMIDDEQVGITAFDPDTGVSTIKRGVADTIPAQHATESLVWLTDDEMVSDRREYLDGETVNAKVLTRTASDLLAPEDAAELEIEIRQRLWSPYPPADVRIDGDSIYALTAPDYPEPELTFVGRNRLTQMDGIVGHGESGIAVEAGTEYRVRVYGPDGVTLLETYDFADAPWTYDSTMQAADGAIGVVWMELVSVRDTLESYFPYKFLVPLSVGLRITELGDNRMTESGDLRSLED